VSRATPGEQDGDPEQTAAGDGAACQPEQPVAVDSDRGELLAADGQGDHGRGAELGPELGVDRPLGREHGAWARLFEPRLRQDNVFRYVLATK
jgi:hypothetical protein